MIITISRQVATNGELIGRAVAERLGLRFFDRELVDELARRLQVDPNVVLQFDESLLNPIQSVIREWQTNINEQTYIHSLRQALQRILHEGNAVVIGRGGNFVMRCPDCLQVRIVAPLALRRAIYRTSHDVSEREAERLIIRGDRERANFVKLFFHADIDDPVNYDVTLNLTGLSPETAVDIIVNAAKDRAAQQVPFEVEATLPYHVAIMARHRHPIRPSMIEPEGGIEPEEGENRKIA
ncbi:MAG TPA: cytidylate kinase-like family protein [Armatimonadota bacterium]|nr:cytidylate kinase-like family protein [Armatimonadota bacterium]